MAKRIHLPKITVLVEGENELNYWRKMGFLGVPKKFNLWQEKENKVTSLLRTIGNDEQIIIIADTDITSETDNFINNVLRIKRHCKLLPCIIWQIRNFEEELSFSCGCKLPKLLEYFSAQSVDEFKNKFNKINQLSNRAPAKLSTC